MRHQVPFLLLFGALAACSSNRSDNASSDDALSSGLLPRTLSIAVGGDGTEMPLGAACAPGELSVTISLEPGHLWDLTGQRCDGAPLRWRPIAKKVNFTEGQTIVRALQNVKTSETRTCGSENARFATLTLDEGAALRSDQYACETDDGSNATYATGIEGMVEAIEPIAKAAAMSPMREPIIPEEAIGEPPAMPARSVRVVRAGAGTTPVGSTCRLGQQELAYSIAERRLSWMTCAPSSSSQTGRLQPRWHERSLSDKEVQKLDSRIAELRVDRPGTCQPDSMFEIGAIDDDFFVGLESACEAGVLTPLRNLHAVADALDALAYEPGQRAIYSAAAASFRVHGSGVTELGDECLPGEETFSYSANELRWERCQGGPASPPRAGEEPRIQGVRRDPEGDGRRDLLERRAVRGRRAAGRADRLERQALRVRSLGVRWDCPGREPIRARSSAVAPA